MHLLALFVVCLFGLFLVCLNNDVLKMLSSRKEFFILGVVKYLWQYFLSFWWLTTKNITSQCSHDTLDNQIRFDANKWPIIGSHCWSNEHKNRFDTCISITLHLLNFSCWFWVVSTHFQQGSSWLQEWSEWSDAKIISLHESNNLELKSENFSD